MNTETVDVPVMVVVVATPIEEPLVTVLSNQC